MSNLGDLCGWRLVRVGHTSFLQVYVLFPSRKVDEKSIFCLQSQKRLHRQHDSKLDNGVIRGTNNFSSFVYIFGHSAMNSSRVVRAN